MTSKRALFYITHEWRPEKEEAERLKILQVAVIGGLADEVYGFSIEDAGAINTLLDIMRTEEFSSIIEDCLAVFNTQAYKDPDYINHIRGLDRLIGWFFAVDHRNKKKEIMYDYFRWLITMKQTQQVITLLMVKEIIDKPLMEMDDRVKEIVSGYMYLDKDDMYTRIFMEQLDKLDFKIQ